MNFNLIDSPSISSKFDQLLVDQTLSEFLSSEKSFHFFASKSFFQPLKNLHLAKQTSLFLTHKKNSPTKVSLGIGAICSLNRLKKNHKRFCNGPIGDGNGSSSC